MRIPAGRLSPQRPLLARLRAWLTEMPRTVKSAVRALEVLELFDRLRREASVGEVARLLGYPLSSTSVLLATLTGRGYLQPGTVPFTYRPTLRLARLGAWIGPFGNGSHRPVQAAVSRLDDVRSTKTGSAPPPRPAMISPTTPHR
jgi:hypothetical protein